MNRILFLDSETTGLDLENNRMIELAIVESIDRELTNNNLRYYFKVPQMIEPGAIRVHGITNEFLADKGAFKDHAEEILNFIRGAHSIIIHNATFDVLFLNKELKLAGYRELDFYCRSIKDSLALARILHPGQGNSLDSLCKRYNISLAARDLHGALIDADLLYQAFWAMCEKHQNSPIVQEVRKDMELPVMINESWDNTSVNITAYKADDNAQALDAKLYEFFDVLENIDSAISSG